MQASASLARTSTNQLRNRAALWAVSSMVVLSLSLGSIGLAMQALSGKTSYGMGLPFGIATLVFAATWEITGAVIVTKHPRHPIGWLMVGMIAFTGVENFAFGLLAYAMDASTGGFPGSDLAFVAIAWGTSPFFFLGLTLMLLLYPNGQLPFRGWAMVGWLDLVAVLGYMALAPFRPAMINAGIGLPGPLELSPERWRLLQPLFQFMIGLVVICLFAAAVSLVRRFRESKGVERQQLKWFVYPATLVILALSSNGLLVAAGSASTILPIAGLLSILALAISLAFAILRYRLYDIDVIINRSLVYGTLTLILAATYFLCVVLIQNAVRLMVGQESPVAVVASTLIVFALSQPLRSRLQRFIDSRFYRTRYDLTLTLDQFGSTLAETLDMEAQVSLILSTVDEAIKPVNISLWIRNGSR